MKLQCPFTPGPGNIIIRDRRVKSNKRQVVTFVEKKMPAQGEVFDISLVPCVGGIYAEYESHPDLVDDAYLRRYNRLREDGIESFCFEYRDGNLVPTYTAFHQTEWNEMSMFNSEWSYTEESDRHIIEQHRVNGLNTSTEYSVFGSVASMSRELSDNKVEKISFFDGKATSIEEVTKHQFIAESNGVDTKIETRRSAVMDSKMYYEHNTIHSTADMIVIAINRNRTGHIETIAYTKPGSNQAANFAWVDENANGIRYTRDLVLAADLHNHFANVSAPEDYEIELMGLRLGLPVILLDIPQEYREKFPADDIYTESNQWMTMHQSKGRMFRKDNDGYLVYNIVDALSSNIASKYETSSAKQANDQYIKAMFEKLRNTLL